MNKFNPDTYCGIYCGSCSVAMCGSSGHSDVFAACLGNIPKEELACCGCKSDTVYAGCSICSLRRCAREKGIEHCIDCADYPCKMYRAWQSTARFLPHTQGAPSGLEAIKQDGVGPWLTAQKKRWSCPDCGTPFSWYAQACHRCGCNLMSETYRLSGWKKLLCRLIFPMVYRKAKAKKLQNTDP